MRRLIVLILGTLAFQGMALAQTRDLSTQGTLLDRIAAVVNDGVVLESEVDAQMKDVTTRLQAQNMALPADSVLRKQSFRRPRSVTRKRRFRDELDGLAPELESLAD